MFWFRYLLMSFFPTDQLQTYKVQLELSIACFAHFCCYEPAFECKGRLFESSLNVSQPRIRQAFHWCDHFSKQLSTWPARNNDAKSIIMIRMIMITISKKLTDERTNKMFCICFTFCIGTCHEANAFNDCIRLLIKWLTTLLHPGRLPQNLTVFSQRNVFYHKVHPNRPNRVYNE